MDIGISSYSFTWAVGVPGQEPEKRLTVYDLIDLTGKLEVKVLQIADNLPFENFPIQDLKKIKSYADQLGIRIEVGARGMRLERLQKYLEIAQIFESDILRFVIDEPGFEPDLNEINAIVRLIKPELENTGITLAIENHDRLKAHEFVEIVKNADSEKVGICLDSVNSMGAGEGLETVIGLLAPYTANLHVKEFSIRRVSHKMGFVIEGAPLGKGMLPVAELIEKVPDTCRSAILEQWTPPEQTIQETIEKEMQWTEESISFLKTLLK